MFLWKKSARFPGETVYDIIQGTSRHTEPPVFFPVTLQLRKQKSPKRPSDAYRRKIKDTVGQVFILY